MKSLGAFGAVLGVAAAGIVALSAFASTTSTTSAQQAGCASADGDGCLIVIKETDIADDQGFGFIHSHAGDGDLFTLEDGEQAVFVMEDDAAHSVTEITEDGWVLDDIVCAAEGAEVEYNVAGGTVTVTRTADDGDFATATCVFYNEYDGDEDPSPTATVEATETPGADPTATPAVSSPPPAAISPPATGSGGLASSMPVAPVAALVATIFLAVCASATLLQKQQ